MSTTRSIPVTLHGTVFVPEDAIEEAMKHGETEQEAIRVLCHEAIDEMSPDDRLYKLRDWQIAA